LQILLFTLSATLVFVTTLLLSFSQYLLSRAAYYVLFGLFITWIVVLVRTAKVYPPDVREFLRTYGIGILFSLALTAFIFLSTPPDFRIQADESKLLNVSASMFFEQKTDNITQGIQLPDRSYLPLFRNFPQRALLFPFLTHIVHLARGYDPFNPFVLNFITLFALFSLLFVFFKRQFGPWAGYAALLLVAAQPVLTQSASSAGLDVFSILFTVIAIITLQAFLKNPSSMKLNLLIIHLVLLAHTRQETILFGALTVVFLWAFRYLKWEWIKSSWFLAITPLLVSPILWQRRALTFDYVFENPPGGIAFSFDYFVANAKIFFMTFFDFSFHLPFATIVNLLGLAACLYFLVLLVMGKWPQQKFHRHLVMILLAYLGLRWILFCSFYHGDVSYPLNSRYYALFFMMLSLITVAMLFRIRFLQRYQILVVLFAGLLFAPYHSQAMKNEFFSRLYLPREFHHVMNFLKDKDLRKTLLITDSPDMYSGYHLNVVNYEFVNEGKEKFPTFLEEISVKNVYVIQRTDPKTQAINEGMQLDPYFQMELVREIPLDAKVGVRISRMEDFGAPNNQ